MASDVIAAKLQQANEIKKNIRIAANTKDVSIPDDAPFADYPGYIANIPGHLQTKTLTPTAEGVTAYPDDGYDGFSSVEVPAEANLIPANIAEDISIFGITGTYEGKGIEEVSTEAEMDALLVSGNIGKVYRYIGEDTDIYTSGDLYEVEESDDA